VRCATGDATLFLRATQRRALHGDDGHRRAARSPIRATAKRAATRLSLAIDLSARGGRGCGTRWRWSARRAGRHRRKPTETRHRLAPEARSFRRVMDAQPVS
jgi:hypothetical protein